MDDAPKADLPSRAQIQRKIGRRCGGKSSNRESSLVKKVHAENRKKCK
jgi:hypothetical protein